MLLLRVGQRYKILNHVAFTFANQLSSAVACRTYIFHLFDEPEEALQASRHLNLYGPLGVVLYAS